MKIEAIEVDGHALFSRARHDFRSFGDYSVDAGIGVGRCLYPNADHRPNRIWIELKGVTAADIYNDWNWRGDKYGIHKLEDVKILSEDEIPDVNSIDYKNENRFWVSYGKDGKGKATAKLIKDLETDHLQAILDTQWHISDETREYIKGILAERN